MPESYDPLSPLDLEQFDKLIAQEGYTLDGQTKRLGMIEPLIRQRIEITELERRKNLAKTMKDDRLIDARIKEEFQQLHFEHIKVNGRLAAVVVEKSSVPANVRANYTVMIPTHVDTIVPRWSSYKPENQRAEPDASTGRISSVGVWDEGQAVLNAIAVIADLHVPEGMRVYAAFVRGEETPQSLGANALIAQWGGMEEVDLVLSQEIGPLPRESMPSEGDTAMRYIVARPGRARMIAKFKLSDDARGHASIPGLPNAKAERDRFQVWMEEIFSGEDPHGFDYGVDPDTSLARTSLTRTHPLLGEERIDTGKEWYPDDNKRPTNPFVEAADLEDDEYADIPGRDTDYVHVSKVHSKFYFRPVRDIQSALAEVKQMHAHIGIRRKWAERGILSTVEMFEGEQSYPPFAMPDKERNVAVKIAHEMLTKVAGVEAVSVRGDSVADENLYAEELRANANLAKQSDDKGEDFADSAYAVISIPPIGNHAHSPNEWTSVDDVARVRHAFMRLLRDPDGYAKLAKT